MHTKVLSFHRQHNLDLFLLDLHLSQLFLQVFVLFFWCLILVRSLAFNLFWDTYCYLIFQTLLLLIKGGLYFLKSSDQLVSNLLNFLFDLPLLNVVFMVERYFELLEQWGAPVLKLVLLIDSSNEVALLLGAGPPVCYRHLALTQTWLLFQDADLLFLAIGARTSILWTQSCGRWATWVKLLTRHSFFFRCF